MKITHYGLSSFQRTRWSVSKITVPTPSTFAGKDHVTIPLYIGTARVIITFFHHVALAIGAPTEELDKIRIGQAEHYAKLARESALPISVLKP